jgi:hypothetical protein
MNRQNHVEPLATDGLFLAARIWRDGGVGRDIALPCSCW